MNMLLDNLFAADRNKQVEMIIVRQDGVLKHVTKQVDNKILPNDIHKGMFPISKERK